MLSEGLEDRIGDEFLAINSGKEIKKKKLGKYKLFSFSKNRI